MTENPHAPRTEDTHEDAVVADITKHEHDTLKYHLLGPSLTKAGQDAVDQTKVNYMNTFGDM